VSQQPSTAVEFRDLVSAAMSECFEGYGADGDSHWRLASIREWWRTREDMLLGGIFEPWRQTPDSPLAGWKGIPVTGRHEF